MVPGLGSLLSLECESCHIVKHVYCFFPSRVNKQAESPFSLVRMFGVLAVLNQVLVINIFLYLLMIFLDVLGYFQ